MDKCSFGQSKHEFLGKTISSQGISPIEHKIDSFLKNLNGPATIKSLQRYMGFVKFYRQYVPNLAEKLVPLYEFEPTDTIRHSMFEINENLAKAAKLSLKLPLPEKQLVVTCDASEHAARYVLLTEDYTDTAEGPPKICTDCIRVSSFHNWPKVTPEIR